MKRVCIFGADGRTGREVVRYAKKRGYSVAPFSYSDGQDVLDAKAVYEAVSKCDAIISTIGHIKGSDSLMQTKGMHNIVKAMQEHNIKRILSLTGTGVRIDGDTPSFIDRVLNYFVQLADPERVQDGIQHAKVLQESGLDWTIVRVLKLGTGVYDGAPYALTNHGPAELITSREKVAHILVDLLEDTSYYQKMPIPS